MPGLIAFGRRWSIGGDDLVIPACIMVGVNITWTISLLVSIFYIHARQDLATAGCPDKFHFYSIGSVGVLVICIACDTAIAFVSAQGGVYDSEKRLALRPLIYLRTALSIFKIVWLIVGIGYVIFVAGQGCRTTDFMFKSLCVILGLNVVVVAATILGIYFFFDPSGRAFQELRSLSAKPTANNEETRRAYRNRLRTMDHEKWLERVSCTGSCIEAESKPAEVGVFKSVAVLFSSYFENTDMVMGDFVAGMMLLRDQQQEIFNETVKENTNDVYMYLSGVPISPRTRFLTLKHPDVQVEFRRMVHFMGYALSGYGWQGQCFYYPSQCYKRVAWRCCAQCCNDKESNFLGDNCCRCQYSTIVKSSPMEHEGDLLYGDYENPLQTPSFYVCLDHKYKQVVVCVRGTMSISDALIDLQGDCMDLKWVQPGPEFHGHRGMVVASDNILKELANEQVLEKAFEKAPDYKLLLIGHSLGAGVAAILAFSLKGKYPDLYCYSYSPPGGLLSPAAAEESKKFITSVVLGKDIVPRMGMAQLEYFRSDILQCLKHSSTPKWKILSRRMPVIGHCCSIKTTKIPRSRSRTYSPFESREVNSTNSALFPPGRVIHILKNYPKDGSSSKPLYQPIWIDNASLDTIVVSPSMFNDHHPKNVLKAMQEVLMHFGPKKPDHFLSEEERQATLQTDCLSDGDNHSNDSGLSWEFTCQSEASVALKTPVLDRLLKDDVRDTPTQWTAATLASFEDLSNILNNGDSSVSNTLRRLGKRSQASVASTPCDTQKLIYDTSYHNLISDSTNQRREPSSTHKSDFSEDFTEYPDSHILKEVNYTESNGLFSGSDGRHLIDNAV